MRVGVLTGGGDCPGLNAVIRAVTKSLIHHGHCEVLGIEDGFEGLMLPVPRVRALGWDEVSGILHTGGTILGTSNSANPLRGDATVAQVRHNARELGLDMLVVIGGDGTMSLAYGLHQRIGLPCVGVPKTIDNDIANCDRSFGFDTAVATATEGLRRIESTAYSHHRVMIVETMGRHAGWLALESGIAAGADIILLPEIDFDVEIVAARCRQREQRQRYSIICIGEGAKESGTRQTMRERVAHSPEPLRLGGVANVLRERLAPHLQSEVRATVLGHLQRGGDPTAFDRVLATRFGHRAAQLVIEGATGRMVTLQRGEISSVPMSAVANVQRTVPLDHDLVTTARDIGICFGDQ
ncbi:6-phosphofructokinase [Diaphorobacter aerolatus]|uniref:ATP-dependent 6-phosphofructokinase n=1 Tax=Diaphorobacter aerolatus TaxID=1288495 RepID=A0A7H0GI75_9BURK|nr:ATP-dependent 6-phosphofructokinase [Diaphorobacter aerolatus]QNP47991.1 ATP-dependent 6-phosphofructokinase [Diaphorobacter aerolatus]